MHWLALKIETGKSWLEEVSQMLNEQGSGGVVVEDPDTILAYAESGQWDAYEFDEETLKKTYSVTGYFPVDEFLAPRLEEIRMVLDRKRAEDPTFTFVIYTTQVDEEDWANSWKQFFKVVPIGQRTVIKPSWEEYQAKPGEIVIDLDPGMAFGTGNHATTSIAMELAEKYCSPGDRVIDVGTGSGIIAIQTALLGAEKVYAYDYDPVAVRAAAENVANNGLSEIISVGQNDLLAGVEHKGNLVVANIVADIILRLLPQTPERLLPGGTLIICGIIEKRLAEVEESLETLGYVLLEKQEREGWYGMALRRPGQ